MILKTVFILCVSLTLQSSAQLGWFGELEQSAAHFVEQTTNHFAKAASDFARFADKSKESQRNFTLSEVAQCTGQNGGCLYMIYDGKVLDLTDFVSYHSGGAAVLLQYAGRDASEAMRAAGMPPEVFDVFVQRFVIGRLVPAESSSARSPRAAQNCSWLENALGICESIIRVDKVYEHYNGIVSGINKIVLWTNAAYDKIVKTLQ